MKVNNYESYISSAMSSVYFYIREIQRVVDGINNKAATEDDLEEAKIQVSLRGRNLLRNISFSDSERKQELKFNKTIRRHLRRLHYILERKKTEKDIVIYAFTKSEFIDIEYFNNELFDIIKRKLIKAFPEDYIYISKSNSFVDIYMNLDKAYESSTMEKYLTWIDKNYPVHVINRLYR